MLDLYVMGQGFPNFEADSRTTKRARERVFDTASDLFYRKGIHAVGVEEIVRVAGVAKISLYRSFSSKDELVVAYLERRGAIFLDQWDRVAGTHPDNAREQLRAVISYVVERAVVEGYRGCPFINFCAEFPDSSHPGRRIAQAIKQGLLDRFLQIAEALSVQAPSDLANALLLLVEGAYAISQTAGSDAAGIVSSLGWASEALVQAQVGMTNDSEVRQRRTRSSARA